MSHKNTDQILGFTFGEVLADNGCVIADMYVRTPRGQGELEGKRSGIVIHRAVLEEILAAKDQMLAAMAEVGANQDILQPARIEIPEWNQGPTLRSTGGDLFLCQSFGISEVVAELGAVAAVIEVSRLGDPSGQVHQGDYLIPHHVLLTLIDTIPQVLAMVDEAGSAGAQVVH